MCRWCEIGTVLQNVGQILQTGIGVCVDGVRLGQCCRMWDRSC